MRGTKIVLLACFLGTLFSGGCAWNRSRTNISDFHDRVEGIVVGKTKIADVPKLVGGPPNNIIPTSDGGQVLLYTFGDSKKNSLNLLIVNFSRTNVGVDSALIIVNKDGVVQQVSVSENSKELTWDYWPFGV